jgi:vitamin B12 transporter
VFRLFSMSAVVGLCCILNMPAKADDRSPPVVVTATRVPTSIEDLGSSVTVIDAGEIERRQWRTLPDALAAVPGLHVVQSGGTGSTTAVFMRGGNSNHTLVLIDGVPASDPSHPSGAYDFAHILLEDVERIEIVRSPQSTQYGSDALGGVIQIFTRRGQGPVQVSGQVEAGSFRSHLESASLRGATPLIHYALNVTHSDTAGQSITPERLRAGQPSDADGYRNTTYSGRVGITPTSQMSVQLISRYIKSHADLDVGSGEDLDSYNKTSQALNRLEASGRFFNDFWKPMLAISHTWHHRLDWNERQTPLGDEDHTRYNGERLKTEFQNDFRASTTNTLSLGAEAEKESMKSEGESVYGSTFGDFIISQNTNASARSSAVYLLDQHAQGKYFRISGGLRMDNHDSFDPVVTWRVTPLVIIPDSATRLKASVGTGYKAPSLYERYGRSPTNYGTQYLGNPNLQPEESAGWETGIEQALLGGRMDTGVTYFQNRYDNLIQTIYLPSFDSTTVNINGAESRGGELYLSMRPVRSVQLRFDYTYTRTRDDNGLELLRRPRHRGYLAMDYHPMPKLGITAEALHVGERQDIDRVSGLRITAPDYTVVNVGGSWSWSQSVSIYARIDNLLNREYEPASGFQALGRAGFIGLKGTI